MHNSGSSTVIRDLSSLETHLLSCSNDLRLLLSGFHRGSSEMTDTLIPNGCKTNGPVESGYFKKVRVTRSFISVFLDVSGGDKFIRTFYWSPSRWIHHCCFASVVLKRYVTNLNVLSRILRHKVLITSEGRGIQPPFFFIRCL